MTTIWQVLEIEPTRETGLIRKAYARRLKVTRPDDDPVAFATLRTAYEAALDACSHDAEPLEHDATVALETTLQSTATTDPEPVQPDPPDGVDHSIHGADTTQEALNAAIIAAIAENDTVKAVRLFQAADAKETLSLHYRMQFAEELAYYLLRHDAIPPDMMTETIALMGWTPDQCTGSSRFDIILKALFEQRVQYNQWFNSLNQQARDWRYWIGQKNATAARLVLGRGRAFLSCLAIPHEEVRSLLEQIKQREALIGQSFDPVRLNHLLYILKKPAYLTNGLIPFILVMAFVVLHLALVEHFTSFIAFAAFFFRNILSQYSRRSSIMIASAIALILVGISAVQAMPSTDHRTALANPIAKEQILCRDAARYAQDTDIVPRNYLADRTRLEDSQNAQKPHTTGLCFKPPVLPRH